MSEAKYMSTHIEANSTLSALKQALEALEANVGSYHPLRRNAITSLRQAIAEAEKQEPVIGTKTWFEDGKVVTQHLHPSDIYKDPQPKADAAAQHKQSTECVEPKPFGYTLEETMKCWDLGYAAAVKALSKQEQPYADKAASVSNDRIKIDPVTGNVQIGTAKQEQSTECVGEPVAYIHRNEYNEYRLEPHDNFDIKSIPFNVDVLLFKAPQRKPLTDEQIFNVARDHYNPHQRAEISFARAIEAAHGIKE